MFAKEEPATTCFRRHNSHSSSGSWRVYRFFVFFSGRCGRRTTKLDNSLLLFLAGHNSVPRHASQLVDNTRSEKVVVSIWPCFRLRFREGVQLTGGLRCGVKYRHGGPQSLVQALPPKKRPQDFAPAGVAGKCKQRRALADSKRPRTASSEQMWLGWFCFSCAGRRVAGKARGCGSVVCRTELATSCGGPLPLQVSHRINSRFTIA